MSLTLPAAALVFALCLDSFFASFSFGAQQIRIPFLSAVVVSGVCSLTLFFSLLLGSLFRPFLPESLCTALGFAILLLLGILRLMDSGIKNLIRHSQSGSARLQFHFLCRQHRCRQRPFPVLKLPGGSSAGTGALCRLAGGRLRGRDCRKRRGGGDGSTLLSFRAAARRAGGTDREKGRPAHGPRSLVDRRRSTDPARHRKALLKPARCPKHPT